MKENEAIRKIIKKKFEILTQNQISKIKSLFKTTNKKKKSHSK
jgi:hypothetical protein